MKRNSLLIAACAAATLVWSQFSLSADEARQSCFNHGCNVRRTGFTAEQFRPPYHLAWTHRFAHRPRPAWREPAWEVQRIDLDYAYAIAADDQRVYVASSSDHAVHAVSLDSGQECWRFFTEGPVRLSPTVCNDKLYFTSDDGWAYCVQAADGTLIWKYRPAIPDERLIGNEQMVNRWPARSGVLVDGDRAYTTFGMWSTEGIVIACLNASSGEVIWQNDSSGTRYMTQPHYEAMGGVSPQGDLALCGDVLVVPCGRAAPAMFDAGTGEFLYDEAEGLFPGGAWTMTFDDLVFTPCEYLKKPNPVAPEAAESEICEEASLVALRAETGEEVFHLHGALRGVIDDAGQLSLIGRQKLVSVALSDVLEAAPDCYEPKRGSSEGHFVEVADHQRWETPVERVYELLQAGSTLIAGGRKSLACYDAATGKPLWQTTLAGDVRDLLLAGDSLLVSTTAGELHCFRLDAPQPPRVIEEEPHPIAIATGATQQADVITAAAGTVDGYGVAIGDVDIDLLGALIQRTSIVWHWPVGERDVASLRAKLADVGWYGPRVAIHNVTSDPLPYADYCANLLVFLVGSDNDLNRVSAAEIQRVLRPGGGRAVVVCDEDLRPAVDRWLAASDLSQSALQDVSCGVRIEREPLPGAGSWTHQYANAGKTGASSDQLVRLPMKMLWFGGLGPADIISRHYRAPAPLAIDGRMFVAGMDYLHAVDAYNGRILWERRLPGVGRWPAAYRGGCIAADHDAVYAIQNRTCLKLDPQTGETLFTYRPPEKAAGEVDDQADAENPLIWEYLAVVDDAVVGTLGRANIRRSWWSMAHPANRTLFVLDKSLGKTRWTYQSASAIDSNAVAIDDGRLFLLDGLASAEVFPRDLRRGQGSAPKRQRAIFTLPGAPHERSLKAFDVASGSLLWQTHDLGPQQNSLCAADGVVLTSTPIWHGMRPKTEGPGLSAFSAADGRSLWTYAGQTPPPVVAAGVAFVPDALDIQTGKPILREDPLTGRMVPFKASVTGGCAQLAGCDNVLMKRSGSLGFFDVEGRSGVYHFPNMRASCWVNMIPACGLVLVPDGSSSCPCAYNYKTSIALMPAERQNHWGLYTSSPRPKVLPIERLQLNFGAPGDRLGTRDEADIWFAYPRPSTRGPRGAGGMGRVPYDELTMVTTSTANAAASIRRNPDWCSIDAGEHGWLYANGLAGELDLEIQLAPQGSKPRSYRVSLHFCEIREHAQRSACDVSLQGKEVLKDFTPISAAGGPWRPVVRDFVVQATDTLSLQVKPIAGSAPLLNAMKIQAIPSP